MKRRPSKAQVAESRAHFGKIWDEVMPEATSKALKYVRESKKRAPSRLLHFTDAHGVAGILGQQVLWLARARASTDSSELRYGLGIAKDCLEALSRKDDWFRTFKEEVTNGWDGVPFFDVVRPIPEPHIFCFAVATPRNEKSIAHWSMYGSSGSGMVLVFDGHSLARKEKVDLVRVVYEPAQQRAMMTTLLRAGLDACIAGRIRASRFGPTVAEHMFRTLCRAVASLAAIVAAAMKAPQFSIEDEWRFVVSYIPVQLSAEEQKDQLPLLVRASGTTLKSYFQLPITPKDLKGVVLGPGASELNEPVIKMLLDDKGYLKTTEVRIGTTPLRART